MLILENLDTCTVWVYIWRYCKFFFPELHRKHTHIMLSEQIVPMIKDSDTPINFY